MSAFMRMGEVYLTFARYEQASYIAMFEAGLQGDEVSGLKEAGKEAFAVLTKAAQALGGTGPDGQPISAQTMSAHIWALSHGMATLFGGSKKAGKNSISGDVSELFGSGMKIYSQGVGDRIIGHKSGVGWVLSLASMDFISKTPLKNCRQILIM